jgi:hypothetical protein
MRLVVVEDIRNVYYHYAARKAKQIKNLREIIFKLVGHGLT